MGFLQILEALLGLVPTVINTVKAVQTAIPQAGAGADKLNAVLSTVSAAAAAAPAITTSTGQTIAAVNAGDSNAMATGLTNMINAFVALFNATGAFQKSGVVQAINKSNEQTYGA